MSHIADLLREEQSRDDEIEEERQMLLRKLSVDFLLDAMTCADTAKLADLVTLYKSGDTMLLGLGVREIIDEYVEHCAKVA